MVRAARGIGAAAAGAATSGGRSVLYRGAGAAPAAAAGGAGAPPYHSFDAAAGAAAGGGALPGDGGDVLQRRGAWLLCAGPFGRAYCFNEQTGAAQWGTEGTPFFRDPGVRAHEEEVCATPAGRGGDLLTVQRLRKVWPPAGNAPRAKVAVDGVSFGVRRGELFAFLGTNGAGKTTTLSMLSGEFAPTEGRALIGARPGGGGGYDVVADAASARRSLGYCPQFDALLDHMTPAEHLRLFAALRGIPAPHTEPNIELLLTGLGLRAHQRTAAKSLSGGNRRKLSVACALLGAPPVVLLDEPSAGMDPVARRGLWSALECAVRALGLSVVLTTHHLEEVEGLNTLQHRVTIMVDGRLQCLGTLGQLKAQLGDAYEVQLTVAQGASAGAVKAWAAAQWPRARLLEEHPGRLSYSVPRRGHALSAVFAAAEGAAGRGVGDYSVAQTSLEQVFARISERALREEDAAAYADAGGAAAARAPRPPSAPPPADGGGDGASVPSPRAKECERVAEL